MTQHSAHKTFLAITLMVLASAFMALPAAGSKQTTASAQNMSVWQLEQTCQASGRFRMQLCDSAIRIDIPRPGFTMIAQAPDWTVYVYNQKRRRFVTFKYPDFKGFRKDTLFAVWFRDRKWVPFGPPGHWQRKIGLQNYRIDRTNISELGDMEVKAVMRVTNDIPISVPAARIYCFAMKIPNVNKLAIEGTIPRSMMGVDSSRYLQTTAIAKATVPKSTFQLPKGYLKADKESDVTHDDDVDSVMDVL